MKRCFVSLVVLTLTAPLAHGHFIWIVPAKDGATAQVVFSDIPKPDDPKLLPKIAQTKWFVRDADGKATELKWTEGKDSFTLVPSVKNARMLGGTCTYGVVQRGKDEPFLLVYSACAVLGPVPRKICTFTQWNALPFQVVACDTSRKEWLYGVALKAADEWNLVEGAEVVAHLPGQEKAVERKTDMVGSFTLPESAPGLVGIRVRHVEKKAGKHDGKEYEEIRYYTTLVLEVPGKNVAEEPVKPDSAATKLLAEARAARATWNDFPGFTADVAVNFDGKTARGKVHVTAKGKVTVEGMSEEFEPWTRGELSSLVGHRLPGSGERETPCAFTDAVEDHPLGRSIRVLNDELHSGYRIRGKEIVVVNRTMKDRRFTITVLESIANKDGKFLTTSFAVDYWNLETGDLVRSVATSQTWTRVGGFDLPGTTRVITARGKSFAGETAKEDAYTAKSLTLTNFQLQGEK